jgi:predicted phosphate transport protein (TIGR00153 family)
MATLFRKTRELERQIDEFLDVLVEGGLLFQQGVRFYLEDRPNDFEERCARLRGLESRADDLRRAIQNRLYSDTLIPQSRGDVLGILESSDKVLNMTAETLVQFSVEIPEFPREVRSLYLELAEMSVAATDSMVKAIRSYFRDLAAVRDHIIRVSFHEKEADKISEKIKRIVFRMESLDLSRKFHLRYFALHIDSIADTCEDVCDRLAIASIKRDV